MLRQCIIYHERKGKSVGMQGVFRWALDGGRFLEYSELEMKSWWKFALTGIRWTGRSIGGTGVREWSAEITLHGFFWIIGRSIRKNTGRYWSISLAIEEWGLPT